MVLGEEVNVPFVGAFVGDAKVFFPEEESFQTHSERIYRELS